MIDDDALVGLAKYCIRACHTLRTATEGRNTDSLSRPVRKAIKDLKKYVHPTQSSLSIITSNIRIMRRIESKVGECAVGTSYHRPGSTGLYPALWEREIQKILVIFGVCDNRFGVVKFLNSSRGNRGWTMPSWPTKLNNPRRGPPT